MSRLEDERAIRDALAAFPKGWNAAFHEVREREPGVVEIGPLWEDSDSIAEVITVDTGNYYDNASAMPMAKFVAACNPKSIATLLAELDRLRAALNGADAGVSEGWQDIATAPKDGEFLVYIPQERTRMQVAKWHPNVKTIGGNFAFDLTQPTHWQPLPSAPTQGGSHGK